MATNEVLLISAQRWQGDTSEMVIFNQLMYTNEQGHFKLKKKAFVTKLYTCMIME